MLQNLSGTVYAFEPFPGNHRFFDGVDPRIVLIKKALADKADSSAFRVSAVITPDSAWGKLGMSGYSSLGYLATDRQEADLVVETVRADSVIPMTANIDFVKLDVQGGELDALKGMDRFLQRIPLLWVEFTGQPRLAEFLEDQGFDLFDTKWWFGGKPSQAARTDFRVEEPAVKLSTGSTRWTAFKRRPWNNFEEEFREYRREYRIGWTDLACVNRSRMEDFLNALSFL